MVKENESESIPRFPSFIFIMDTADVQEFLDQIPEEKKVKIFEKMFLELSEYHRKCHDARLQLKDRLDRIIRSVDL